MVGQEEMINRCGLAFMVVDRVYGAKVRQECGFGANPWSTHSRFLVSHALLRHSEYAAPASNTLRCAIVSGLTWSPRDPAPLFEHRVFLSATLHNGHGNSFTVLLELLDPSRFVRGVPFDPNDLDSILVRHLKDDR